MSESRLIVGLGNPGGDYEYTRHNLGFLVVRRLAERFKLKLAPSSLTNGATAEGMFEDKAICLLMPLTFMNNSGVAVRQVMTKKNVLPENMLVVCDDFHLDFEQIRLRAKGSDGGHNGLSSIIQHLGTDQLHAGDERHGRIPRGQARGRARAVRHGRPNARPQAPGGLADLHPATGRG